MKEYFQYHQFGILIYKEGKNLVFVGMFLTSWTSDEMLKLCFCCCRCWEKKNGLCWDILPHNMEKNKIVMKDITLNTDNPCKQWAFLFYMIRNTLTLITGKQIELYRSSGKRIFDNYRSVWIMPNIRISYNLITFFWNGFTWYLTPSLLDDARFPKFVFLLFDIFPG